MGRNKGSISFKLVDQANPKAQPATGKIKVDANGIYIAIDGYGECAAEDGAGTPIGLELYAGHVRVLVWADINSDDASHIINMDEARESQRKPAAE